MTTPTTHTPGPWKLESNFLNIEVGFTVKGRDNRSIVACAATISRPGSEKAANANLIASAPELLEACRAALAILPTGDALAKVEAAIAKAEGR